MAFKKDTKVKTNFTKITIGLASPEEILENSYGEVFSASSQSAPPAVLPIFLPSLFVRSLFVRP